jgi:hypothetical protein
MRGMLVTLFVIPANAGIPPYCSTAVRKRDPRLREGDGEGTGE